MVLNPLGVGKLYKILVPGTLCRQKIVMEMDACGAHRNDGERQGLDAAVADPRTVLVEGLVNEELLAERAANEEVVDARELS